MFCDVNSPVIPQRMTVFAIDRILRHVQNESQLASPISRTYVAKLQ